MASSPKLKILFLGANPKNTTRLRIDEELREIDQQLRLSTARERLSLAQAHAVRANDLQQALIDNEPQIVHFSGHGDTEGIAIEDEHGNAHLISNEAVSDLFGLFKDNVKCVLLNACFSESQAKAILQHIPYVIGMRAEMPDEAAIKFSVGFYKAIAAGKTLEFAFNLGVNAIKLEGIDATLVPQLMKSQNDLMLLPEAEQPVVLTQTQTEENVPKGVLWKWVGGSVAVAALAGIIGFFIAKNRPEHELSYRIGDAKVDLYKNTKDSLLMTFELICDNNTLKNLQFYRDSVTLSFEGVDKKFKSFHDGSPVVNVDKKENKTVAVCFVTPMIFKPLSIYIAQKHGKARVDYGFGNIATNNIPIADADGGEEEDIDEPAPIVTKIVQPTDDDASMPAPKPSSDIQSSNHKMTTIQKNSSIKIKPKPTPFIPKVDEIKVLPKPAPVKIEPKPIVKAAPMPIPSVTEGTKPVTVTGGELHMSAEVVEMMQMRIKPKQ
jgi:CHAT domain